MLPIDARLVIARTLPLLLTAFAAPLPAAPPPGDSVAVREMLVSTGWLAERLNDPSLVLIHVGPAEEFAAAHLPGARYLPGAAIRRPASALTLQMPEAAQLDSVFESLGVSDDSRIVIYFAADWVTPAARAYVTLDYLGLGDRASLLDGGMAKWRKEGRPISAETTVERHGSLTPRTRPEVVAEAEWLLQRLRRGGLALLDARTPEFFAGTDAGHMPRAGHIPGAQNVPFTELVGDDLRLKDAATLRSILKEAGVRPESEVVAYCHIGQQASLLYFVAKYLGHPVRLYDGSFEEWSARADLPVTTLHTSGAARLVSPAELSDLAAHTPISVVDARADLGAYLKDHLPGAVFLHNESLRAAGGGVPADLLPAEGYALLFSRLGIDRGRPVAIYSAGDSQNFNATFLAWLLAGFGHPSVYVLDGGHARWVAEGRPLTRQYPVVRTSVFGAAPFTPDVASLEDVRQALGRSDAVLVDARPAVQFTGKAGPQMRRGHIPGAVSHFWQDDLLGPEKGRVWKPATELRAAYERQGITPDRDVIVYCNTGTEASHLYFALKELLGYPRVRVYVPSWTEWAAREELPVAVTAATSE